MKPVFYSKDRNTQTEEEAKKYIQSVQKYTKVKNKNYTPHPYIFGCSTANFGPLSRGQPHSPDVNHCVLHIRPEGHREPRNEVGSLRTAEHLVGFELGTFRFSLQRLNPLGHSS